MRFISFGCWNKGNPLRKDLPLYHLIRTLEKNIHPVDFIMITGDNYYHHPDYEPYKYVKMNNQIENEAFPKATLEPPPSNEAFPKATLEGGGSDQLDIEHLTLSFSLLNKMRDEKPIYMCAGNHEFKEHKIIKTGEPIDLLEKEKEVFGDDLIVSGFLKEKCNDTLFYVIDTTNIKDYPLLTEYTDIQSELTKNKGINKICIFGHEPIISLKYARKEKIKKGKLKRKWNDWTTSKDLLEWIKVLLFHLPNYEIKYICADTHNYQDMNITLKLEDGSSKEISQTIVGSGGTFNLDPLPLDLSETNEFFKDLPHGIENVRVKSATNVHHGYCIFDTDDLSGDPEFIDFFRAVESPEVLSDENLSGIQEFLEGIVSRSTSQ